MEPRNDLSGKEIRGYKLLARLGAGGMGEVYRASQPVVQREVAVKVILPEYASEPDFIRRFEEEARLVARLEHPFIVPLFDFWRDPDGAYLVTRFFTGGSLRDALHTRRKFDIATTRRMIDQLAGALAVAHRNGIVHRDLKPENILLDDEDNFYLSDFGIARRMAEPEDDEEEFTGSPGYVAPEQIQGQPLTERTDLYSLGYILYEVLSGQHPFINLSPAQMLVRHLNDSLPLNEAIPAEINELIQKATAKNPAERFQGVLALAGAFQAALDVERRGAGHPSSPPETLVMVNPYKGLRAFEEGDAADFFGREGLIERLLTRLTAPGADSRFLAVIGPSGSGKSSVVKAGVIPRLKQLDRTANWFFTGMTPGADPSIALLDALLRVAVNTVPDLLERLRTDAAGLHQAVQGLLPDDSTEIMLVIDQFEEVFTQSDDEAARQLFLASLQHAVTAPDSRLRVIVTLRADFYDRPLLYEGFGGLLREHSEIVLPLTTRELERAIVGPAENAGLVVDPDLITMITGDVGAQPGTLPLLQYALKELFDAREGTVLPLPAYVRSGGISGALARRAEEIYRSLGNPTGIAHDPNATQPRHAPPSPVGATLVGAPPVAAAPPNPMQSVARLIFLRLVTPGEGTEDTRRRARLTDLLAVGDRATVEAVLKVFTNHRLLTYDHDPLTREPTVEVAHEALIRTWARLRDWLNSSRDDLQKQRTLAGLVADWQKANRETSFLLRGGRLAQFEEWCAETDLPLTPDERAFLDASLAQRDAEAEKEREQAERERHLEAQSRQRLRLIVAVTSIAAVVALVLAVFAINQSQVAQYNADLSLTSEAIAVGNAVLAERRAAESRSLLLVNGSQQALSAGQTDLAVALALEAVTLDDPPVPAQRALYNAAYAPGIIRQFTGHGAPVLCVALTGDGTRAASGDLNGGVILWQVTTGAEIRRFAGHSGGVNAIAFDPTDQSLVTAGDDGQVIRWDVATGEVIQRYSGHTAEVSAAVFSPDGSHLLTGGADNIAILWDAVSGAGLLRLTGHDKPVNAVALDADGARALTGSDDGRMILWDAFTGEQIREFEGHSDWVFAVGFAPNGTQAVSGSFDDSIIVWDLATGSSIRRLTGHTNSVQALAFTADGRELLSASSDRTLRRWDLASGALLHQYGAVNSGHRDTVLDVALHDRLAVSASSDGTLLVWSIFADDRLQQYHAWHSLIVTGLAFNHTGSQFASVGFDKRLNVAGVDARTPAWTITYDTWLSSVAFSPDDTRLVTGAADGSVRLWDAANGGIIRRMGETDGAAASFAHSKGVTTVAYRPDGALIASGAGDQTIILWDAATGAGVRQLTGHTGGLTTLAFSPDGATLVSGDATGELRLWDVATGALRAAWQAHNNGVTSARFGGDGSTLITGGGDNLAQLWQLAGDLPPTAPSLTLSGHGGAVWSVALTPDGRFALSASGDQTVRLWDAATGNLLHSFTGHTAGVPALSLSDDGSQVLTGSDNGEIIRWRVDALATVIERARTSRYLPEFTCEQQAQYQLTPTPACE